MISTQITRNFKRPRKLIGNIPSGSTIVVEKQVGTVWTTIASYTASGAWEIAPGEGDTRITPTGTATFEITQ